MDELVTFIENRFTQNVKMIITIIENEEIKKESSLQSNDFKIYTEFLKKNLA